VSRRAEAAAPAPSRRLDPRDWAAVYDSRDVAGEVFRRGSELAITACLNRGGPRERWADIGCGTGHLTARLATAGMEVTGIDADPLMLEFAQARFGGGDETGTTPRFVRADAIELPFDDGALDGIVAASLIGCLDQPAGLLTESSRVLRRGGRVIITFTNRHSAFIAINWWLRRLSGKAALPPYLLPVRLYSRREARSALEHAGFEVEELRVYNFFVVAGSRMLPPPALARSLERACGNRLGGLVGRNFLIVARKP
jgi:ubiquinone/menaquinone biosynthesis C-methylase UbiE